jgi:hypothetical protein
LWERNAYSYTFLIENPEGKMPLGDLAIDGKMTIK